MTTPDWERLVLVLEVMVLRRFTISVDGTIPISALLYDDEDLLASQDSVGIYDGYVLSLPSAGGFYGHIRLIVQFVYLVNQH